jgi:hypothetical protein
VIRDVDTHGGHACVSTGSWVRARRRSPCRGALDTEVESRACVRPGHAPLQRAPWTWGVSDACVAVTPRHAHGVQQHNPGLSEKLLCPARKPSLTISDVAF